MWNATMRLDLGTVITVMKNTDKIMEYFVHKYWFSSN